ncbi:histidinol-phosphate transaminase [Williamsia deligens]|uniref:Aromatic amino acid aminotransferase n=1 Tax=Williamsia deligens TaxID=321325 RepID=A0ABW3GA37_9NOCA|nr:histidinol-phosphate transaminase [Williamsia deligens]MCP2193511.1 histidinol-phosphate aminotransferase [Williamsia deligens]
MTPRIRPDLASVPAYVPGKTFPGSVKLASNEVTFGPLPSVARAIADAATSLNRYPDNGMVELTETIAKKLGVPPDAIQTGCGSVSLCQNLITITCTPGDEVLFAWRSFETYPLATRVAGATPVQVPLTGDRVHDLTAMADAITDRTRLIFVCNPNNPTGTVVEAQALVDFLEKVPPEVVVALDEAYVEYVRPSQTQAYDAIELQRRFSNVVVLRTFSKAYGLAGLRVGYAVADAAVIDGLRRVHVPFSVNSLAQAAATACLHADDELLARTEAVVAERARVAGRLRELGYVVPESQANFVWLDLGDDAAPFAAAALDARVVIRPFAGDGVRVTIGDTVENDQFLTFAGTWAGRDGAVAHH